MKFYAVRLIKKVSLEGLTPTCTLPKLYRDYDHAKLSANRIVSRRKNCGFRIITLEEK